MFSVDNQLQAFGLFLIVVFFFYMSEIKCSQRYIVTKMCMFDLKCLGTGFKDQNVLRDGTTLTPGLKFLFLFLDRQDKTHLSVSNA